MYYTVMQYMYRIYNIDSVMKRYSHGGAEICQAHVVPNWQDLTIFSLFVLTDWVDLFDSGYGQVVNKELYNTHFFFIRIIFIRIIRLKSWKIKNNSRITQGSDPAQSQLWTFLLHSKYDIIEYFRPVCSLLHLQEGSHGYFLPYLHWMWRRVSCHLNF